MSPSRLTRTAIRNATVGLSALLLWSCGSESPVPLGPGEVRGVLVSPHGAEAAAVISLSGTGISDVQAERGSLFQQTDGSLTRVVLILDEPGEMSFTVRVTERSEPPAANVLEVADEDNKLRDRLPLYRVEFTPVPDPPSSSAGPR